MLAPLAADGATSIESAILCHYTDQHRPSEHSGERLLANRESFRVLDEGMPVAEAATELIFEFRNY
jgi:hypothetical protein